MIYVAIFLIFLSTLTYPFVDVLYGFDMKQSFNKYETDDPMWFKNLRDKRLHQAMIFEIVILVIYCFVLILGDL